MSALDRKVTRNLLRKQYNEFTKEFLAAKKSGHLVEGKPLGKKPSFGQFIKRLESFNAIQKLRAQAASVKASPEIAPEDLEWKQD